tara:strand:- start:731 stop:2572 length:1842 start_codon:yes stop_codon:yes gene_type:complete
MKIIGISAFYHDSAVAYIEDGEIIFAAQEERFSRVKHDASFPKLSLSYLFKNFNLNINDIDHIVFYDKPFLTFERLIETYVSQFPRGFKSFSTSMPIWIKEKVFLEKLLIDEITDTVGNKKNLKINFSEHHVSHAASAFYPSPFRDAIILCMDGVGEWVSNSISVGEGNQLKVDKELNFPHSIGLLYSAFTYYTGFRVNSGEYKLMGLAPYGRPVFEKIIMDNLIELKQDGSYKLDLTYFDFTTGDRMISQKFRDLFGENERENDHSEISQFYMDIAASIQSVIEKVVITIGKNIQNTYGNVNLCLAGGVALNCVATGKLADLKLFKDIWVQPASGDAGGALGCALAFYYMELGKKRSINIKTSSDKMKGSLLGPSWSNRDIQVTLEKMGLKYTKLAKNEKFDKVATLISSGKILGWFQGRMEFGPRALGARSILADPRDIEMQTKLNLKIKFRESFRPFAPAILEEDFDEYFDGKLKNNYMLSVAHVKNSIRLNVNKKLLNAQGLDKLKVKRSTLPSITHVDYSARVQTVTEKSNKCFYELLQAFKKITGLPIIINTSFNIRGEPIVNTPEEALNCLFKTDMDCLMIEDFLVEKKEQTEHFLSGGFLGYLED